MARIIPRKSKVLHNGHYVTDYESYSSVSKWRQCPVIFGNQYFLHDREPSTLPLCYGNAFHGLIEDSLIHKQLTGEIMQVPALLSRWEQRWLLEMWQATHSKAGLKLDDVSPERFFEQGLACTEIWGTKWLKEIEPRDVEINFMLTLKDIPRQLMGRLDFTETNNDLDDAKTSGRPYRDAKDEYELQFGIYHVGYFDLYHSWPRKAWILRVESVRSPDIERIDLSLSRERVQGLFDDVVRPAMKQISEAWVTGIFACNCSSHHDTLDFFAEEKRLQVIREAEEAAAEEVLNPEKWRKEHPVDLIPKAEEREKIDSDRIPF